MAALKPIYYYPNKLTVDTLDTTDDTTASLGVLDSSLTYTVGNIPTLFNTLTNVAVDSSGNIFVADSTNNRIRKVTPGGVVTTLAGNNAEFVEPAGVAVDSSGNVFVADTQNHHIRKVTPGGVVTTLAGSGTIGFADDASGSLASFNSPSGVAVDTSGNVFVADTINHRIRKIVISSGAVSTLAGDGYVDNNNYDNGRLLDGTGTAASFNYPIGVALDMSGNLFVGDSYNHSIRKIVISSGAVSTLAGSGAMGSADGTGTGSSFAYPEGVAVDSSGNVFVADYNNHRVRAVTPGGVVTTLAGSSPSGFADGTGAGASFSAPSGVAVDISGNVIVADTGNHVIRKVTPGGVVTTISGTPTVSGYKDSIPSINWNIGWNSTGNKTKANQVTVTTGTVLDASGAYFLYPEDSGNAMYYFASEADASGCLIDSKNEIPVTVTKSLGVSRNYTVGNLDAMFGSPLGVVIDTSGNIYVADTNNHRIRKVTPGGVVTTLAGDGYDDGYGGGRWVDGIGTAASFYGPSDLALDTSGNLFVADMNNNRIRKIVISSGIVSTLAGGAGGAANGFGSAASFYGPEAITLDTSGNIYVADTGNHLIRKIVISSGQVSTLAGSSEGFLDSSGTNAQFDNPSGLALDTDGNLIIADKINNLIRRLDLATTNVITLAGSGAAAFADGIGLAASFNQPTRVAIDISGNIIVADGFNNRIRLVDPVTTDVTTVAGSSFGTFVDAPSGPGSAASFDRPAGMAVDAAGVLFVADMLNCRIRQINISTGGVTTFAGAQAGYKDNNITLPSSQWKIASNSPGLVNTDVIASGSDITNPHGTYFLYPSVTSAPVQAIYYYPTKLDVDTLDPTDSTTFSPPSIAYSTKYVVGLTPTEFRAPSDLAVDASGNIFVADTNNHCIRKITPAGYVTTLAGSGVAGFANGTGTSASFSGPSDVAIDSYGNVFVADTDNACIRKVTPSGVVTTLAGSIDGFLDATGTSARFSSPSGVAVDASGNVFVGDFGNSRIRKVTPGGVVSTLAGSEPPGFADGIGAAASFSLVQKLVIDTNGNIFVPDTYNNRIRKVSPPTGSTWDSSGTFIDASGYGGGVVTTLAGSGSSGFADGTGVAATFSYPAGVAVDASGILFVADNNIIRKVSPPTGLTWDSSGAFIDASGYGGGIVATVAGSGSSGFADGTGSAASFNQPKGLAVDSSGNVFVADTDNSCIRKMVVISAAVTTIAGTPNVPAYKDSIPSINWNIGWNSLVTTAQKSKSSQVTVTSGTSLDASGTYFLYPSDSGNAMYYFASQADASGCLINSSLNIAATLTKSLGVSKNYTVGNLDAMFSFPSSLLIDSSANIIVADSLNHRIRKITPGGLLTALAGSGTQGHSDSLSAITANFNTPFGIDLDNSGNLFIVDYGNNCIRKLVISSGAVTTVAGDPTVNPPGYLDSSGTNALFTSPAYVIVDNSGNLFVSDTGNNCIRKIVISSRQVTTFAGDPTANPPGYLDSSGTNALFNGPTGLALDNSGNLFVSDTGNNRIRQINLSSSNVTTLAGDGSASFLDGLGPNASFALAFGITFDNSGNLFVADTLNNRIRKIVINTAIVTTLAGTGLRASADAPSGPGSAASFNAPRDVALDTSGNLFVTDALGQRIRKLNISTGAVTTLAGAQEGFKNNNITLPSSQWKIASNSPGLVNANVTASGNNIINPHGTYFLYPSAVCFLEGTTVLCFVNGNEEYVPVEKLDKDSLVKTLRDGYKKIDMIAKQELFNPGTDERVEQRLYKCSTSRYPQLTSDLYLTGCHSILVNTITDDERVKLTKQLGRIFVTDKKYRLTACVDERAEPWNSEGTYTVWHFALDHENILMNYGVFVNGGLLVESCSKHVLKNKSDMVFQ